MIARPHRLVGLTALFAVTLSLTIPAAAQAPTPVRRSLSFLKFNVNDLAAMQAFYEKGFGMVQKKKMDFPALTEVVLATPNGADLALVKYKDGRVTQPGTGNGPIGFYLKDVAGAYQQAMAAGAKSVRAPQAGGQLNVAMIQDPEGHEIELLDAN